MFDRLPAQQPDKIIELMTTFRNDPRATKVDLGVGVYKNADGLTPVMGAIKKAEQQLWHDETTKTYVGLAGDAGFHDAMVGLIIGADAPVDRIACAATPGGTGAVRNGLEMIQMANPDASVWISEPTWPNHPSILKYLNIKIQPYRYYDAGSGGVDIEGMMADLGEAEAGDVVLLHGCCHNPTGANLRPDDWRALSKLLAVRGLIPFIDIAYQGFGDGLEEDAFGVRHLVDTLPEVLIAASCSKNFGVYRERVGILIAVSEAAKTASVQASLTALNRLNYSFPPDHGARLVTMVLNDPKLRADWEAELAGIREGLIISRQNLARALKDKLGSDRFGFLADHRGMFSLLGLPSEKIDRLREEFGVYLIGDSRMNIAGLSETSIPLVADAIAAVE
jgi:aromatic-amino-acid transaminase